VDFVIERDQGAVFGMRLRSGSTSKHAFATDRLVVSPIRIGIAGKQAAGFDGDVHAASPPRELGFES
jgi:hypothetical protein